MKRSFYAGVAALAVATIMFTGCSGVPQEEIDAANAAISEAEAAGADVYLHENFVALQDSMNAIMVDIEAVKSKFIKNYSEAKEQLEAVTALAGEVKTQTEARIEEVKTEVQNTISEVNMLIEENRQLVLEAPKGKEGTTALMAMKAEIDATEAAVSEAISIYEAGEYLAALDKAVSAKEKAASLKEELSGVIAKYKANVRSR